MTTRDDIETVKRAADAQEAKRPANIGMEASWPPGRRPAPADRPECPNDNHASGCRCHLGEDVKLDSPLEEALTAAEGWTGPPPQLYADPPPIGSATDMRPEREKLLEEARRAISGDRQRDYGPPTPSFERIAAMWSAILGTEVSAEQYAMCMVAVKLGRLVETPNHRDSWMDIAGYAGLGAEVAATEGRYL
ncbi:phosphofructokinase [Mycobacterium phage Quesadilla]|uniref:DUF6378 domain-containing protein n=1 Tax=Mycobacterium phage Quesadilla TaxID=2664226 RepID=A0A5Q2WFK6_9CAUD|nr:phosphofructokinase [Mycobacterium phage Quesadilla]QGH75305.1 hypothetical protein SEA_QUESADILLA_57 [Mycobacterium phage Quesadilla]